MPGPLSSHRRAKKSLGQNFLIDPNFKRKIITACALQKTDCVLEIGPGRGALTHDLAECVHQLIVIEKDQHLAQPLMERHADNKQIKIFADDFLKFDLDQLELKKVKVIANLPYNVASQILFKLFKHHTLLSHCYLMFQKEVAQRLIAKPNTKDYGLLTLWAEIYSQPTLLFDLPPTVFKPRPKVKSSFMHFKMRSKPLVDDKSMDSFWALMKKLFSQRRKMIGTVVKVKGEQAYLKKRVGELSLGELIGVWRSIR